MSVVHILTLQMIGCATKSQGMLDFDVFILISLHVQHDSRVFRFSERVRRLFALKELRLQNDEI